MQILLHDWASMNNANFTRFTWRSQLSATNPEDKARAKLWQNSVHRHSCMLCKALLVLAAEKRFAVRICLTFVTGQLVKTSQLVKT